MIKWIFFDIGSTLVEEKDSEENRIIRTINNSSLTKDKFDELLKYYSSLNMDAYNVICEKYNLKKQEWININEVLIDDVILILDYLKNKYNLGIIANQPLGTTHRLDNRAFTLQRS